MSGIPSNTSRCGNGMELSTGESLGIPDDITYGMVPHNNASLPAMEVCCGGADNVNFVGSSLGPDCVLWCELTQDFFDNWSGGDDSNPSGDLSHCLRQNEPKNATQSLPSITGGQRADAATAPLPSLAGVGALALLLLGMTGIL